MKQLINGGDGNLIDQIDPNISPMGGFNPSQHGLVNQSPSKRDGQQHGQPYLSSGQKVQTGTGQGQRGSGSLGLSNQMNMPSS